MALEDFSTLSPEKQPGFISDLNIDWPMATDTRSQGDDHIRLIKNALKNTFPGIKGAVKLTHKDINRGVLPAGTHTLFYGDAAPVGWVRANYSDTAMIRVVPWSKAGWGGSMDPVVNEQVPWHNHIFAADTAPDGGHYHHINAIWTSRPNVSHSHEVVGQTHFSNIHAHAGNVRIQYASGSFQDWVAGANQGDQWSHQHEIRVWTQLTANDSHQHWLEGDTNWSSKVHAHYVAGGTGGPEIPTARQYGWYPRYFDMMLCYRTEFSDSSV